MAYLRNTLGASIIDTQIQARDSLIETMIPGSVPGMQIPDVQPNVQPKKAGFGDKVILIASAAFLVWYLFLRKKGGRIRNPQFKNLCNRRKYVLKRKKRRLFKHRKRRVGKWVGRA